jgi:hypothetical protein
VVQLRGMMSFSFRSRFGTNPSNLKIVTHELPHCPARTAFVWK